MDIGTADFIAARFSTIFNCKTCPHRAQKAIDIVFSEDTEPVYITVSFCGFRGVVHPTHETMEAVTKNNVVLTRTCRIIEEIAPVVEADESDSFLSYLFIFMFMCILILSVLLYMK